MIITIEQTEQIVAVNEVPARVWTGHTESGIKVQCLVTRIAVLESDRQDEFQRELQATPAPAPEPRVFPLRMII